MMKNRGGQNWKEVKEKHVVLAPEEDAKEFDLEAGLVENPAHEPQQKAPPVHTQNTIKQLQKRRRQKEE